MTMVEQRFLSLAQPEDLSGISNLSDGGPTTAGAPPASAYPDLNQYGAVSSSPFSLTGQCDPNLLTPISVAGSPPLHQARKLVPQSQYPAPPSTPAAQQPTPPGSTKMYQQSGWPSFDMNGESSQTSSPMAHQAPVAPEYMDAAYLSDERRTPAPHTNYLGAFGVSHPPETSQIEPPYYMQMGHPVDPQHHQLMLRDDHHMQMSVHHRDMHGAPLLNDPHPSQFRPARRPSPEELAAQAVIDGQRSGNGSPRRRPVSAASGRVKKRSAKPRGQTRNPILDDPLEEHKNCFGQEVPPTLKSTCPDEERCIFESRWKHRHQKGQDMWESIQNDFKNEFNKCPGKEMLQMKFKRGRAKYLEWIPKDEDLVREAWIRVEKARYQMIYETFIELGGSRNMRLNASDIEIKVVNDLKLEEGIYMESHSDAHIRRRRKSASTRKRTTIGGVDGTMSDERRSVSSHNTHEDDVINQVHSRQDVKLEDEMSTGPSSMLDIQMWDQSAVMNSRNEPMNRQACEQMMKMSPAAQQYGQHRAS
ncbi:hypothetical protein B0J13DRAFT_229232 [Dactylonectria estremocensis]|uniref:Uncharacterized protein n=1 Tax=Dactylonectria estremocensis TaxID=1079267 RepID=A0A9P9F7K6_9HYPO|nr:hypothetical protein B0J13DRAFT_229232 [Dactylonectria estremocensis]